MCQRGSMGRRLSFKSPSFHHTLEAFVLGFGTHVNPLSALEMCSIQFIAYVSFWLIEMKWVAPRGNMPHGVIRKSASASNGNGRLAFFERNPFNRYFSRSAGVESWSFLQPIVRARSFDSLRCLWSTTKHSSIFRVNPHVRRYLSCYHLEWSHTCHFIQHVPSQSLTCNRVTGSCWPHWSQNCIMPIFTASAPHLLSLGAQTILEIGVWTDGMKSFCAYAWRVRCDKKHEWMVERGDVGIRRRRDIRYLFVDPNPNINHLAVAIFVYRLLLVALTIHCPQCWM